MDRKQALIGICGGICPPPFLEALRDKILATETSNGSKPLVHTAILDWKGVPKTAPKLIQEGDQKLRCFDEVDYLENEGCNVVAIPNFSSLQFLSELQEEFTIPIANIGIACALTVKDNPNIRLGYLGVNGIGKHKAIIETFKHIVDVQWIYLDKKLEPNIDEFHRLMSSGKHSDSDEVKDNDKIDHIFTLVENRIDEFSDLGYNAGINVFQSELERLKTVFKNLFANDSGILSAMDLMSKVNSASFVSK